MQEEVKETTRSRAEGVCSVLLTRAYRTCPVGTPDMSGICELAVFVPKIYSLDSNPLLYYYSVQKGIQS